MNEYRTFTTPTTTVDPTDTGDPEMMRPATRETLSDLQDAYGICSAGRCLQPVWRWCEQCGHKLCYTHLRQHERDHLEAATTIPALPVVG